MNGAWISALSMQNANSIGPEGCMLKRRNWSLATYRRPVTAPRTAGDVVQAKTGKTKTNAGNSLDCVKERYPEVSRNLRNFRFPGRGQRDTPVVDVRGIVEIVMLLPGRHAARVRRQAAELLCRYLGGDLALSSYPPSNFSCNLYPRTL